jgi:carbon storage regulator
MLVLSRKLGEKVIIGDNITLTVVEIEGNRVRFGIDAPSDVRILRAELCEWHDLPAKASTRHETRRPARSTRTTQEPEIASC